jgi:hypothetical protein
MQSSQVQTRTFPKFLTALFNSTKNDEKIRERQSTSELMACRFFNPRSLPGCSPLTQGINRS